MTHKKLLDAASSRSKYAASACNSTAQCDNVEPNSVPFLTRKQYHGNRNLLHKGTVILTTPETPLIAPKH